MHSLKAWCASAFFALLILCISIIGIQRARPVIDVRSIPMLTHMGGLSPQSPPGELFHCDEDGLHQIDLPFVAIAGSRHARVTLKLRADSPDGQVLRESTLAPGLELTGPAWVSFKFEPIEDSGGEMFHFSIEPADEAATSISCWVRYHGQTGINTAWGDRFLQAGETQRGDFISAHAHFRAMAFPVETLFPSLGSATLSIYDSAISKEPLRTTTLGAHDEVNAGWAFFAFEPIPESRWRRYHYVLEVPKHCRLIGEIDENRRELPVYKTFHGLELKDSPLLGMTRDGVLQRDRDLVFRTWCDDSARKVFARLSSRTGGTLWLAALLWVIAATLCLKVFVFLTPDSNASEETPPS